MSDSLRVYYDAAATCEAVGCDRPRRTAIAIASIGLGPVALCAAHYGPVAKAHKGRATGRSKWTPEARHEALVAAVAAAIGWKPQGGEHAAA